ncbi:acyltransferase family protein [Flavobacterium sp. HJJ]|uniref:acyltransferase family protein n=1 Tax=Flavobacterium sp. HJJ TaxID=2783792 RepID=UPI00188BE7BD|nr:acyltransferase [Flavobacterium sp. HJJ]MBF4472568.1 acyltransferase [Flavobacterium sp. HJJ]
MTKIADGSVFSDSKKHFEILDGLRGVAAILVVLFRILEVFSGGDHTKQLINHGYLAVDFFFLLSGFVIAYAYDDRWGRMTLSGFFKRRLIRLHPMIVVGMTIGAVCFYYGISEMFPVISGTPFWKMLLVMVLGWFLMPVPGSLDIRGWGEMYPLNGPAWSLFFEYIANLVYALVLRRLSNAIMWILVIISGAALIHLAVMSPIGDVIGGWSLEPAQLKIGFTRLAFPFLGGILLRRTFVGGKCSKAFLMSSILLVAVLAFPRVGDHETLWMNGIYDSLIIIVVFPVIVYIGANGRVKGDVAQRLCKLLGDISYPIYITHFPILYVFYAWVDKNKITMEDSVGTASLVFALCLIISYLSLKFYDVPVRKWLSKRFL